MKIEEKSYPYPIGANIDRLYGEMDRTPRSHTIEFFILIDLFESILKYLALVGLSNYIEGGNSHKRMDSILEERFLGRPLSLGGWEDLLQTLMRFYRASGEDFFVPEIISFYFRSGSRIRMTKEAQKFRQFISIRNEKLAHGGLKSEGEYQGLMEDLLPVMERLLQKLEFLGKYRLCIPLEMENNTIVKALLCQGSHFSLLENSPLFANIPAPPQENPLLINEENQSLLLYPLLFPDIGRMDGRDDLFFYDKNRRNSKDSSQIQSLEFLGIRHKEHLKIRRGDPQGGLLHHFNQRLQPWISPRKELIEYSLPATGSHQDLLSHLPSTLYGREDVVEKICSQIRRGEGGYILLSAEPGAGKTALMAHLARKLGPSLYHFLSAGSNQIHHWIKGLYGQLIHLGMSFGDHQGGLPTEREKLLRDFWESAIQFAEIEPLVILIDGLDELDDSDSRSLYFLPKKLPQGLFVLLSSRFGALRDRLVSRFSTTEIQLAPLAPPAMARWYKDQLKEQPSGEFLTQLGAHSRGNPLYLKFYLQSFGPDGPRENPVENSLEDLFESRLNKALSQTNAELALSIFGFLTVSPGGFSRRELAEILSVNQLKLGKTLEVLGDFITLSEGLYKLFHRCFREYARAYIFTKADLANYHSRIASHFANWKDDPRAYGLSNLTYHLYQAGDYAGVCQLLSSAFLSAKADYFADPLAPEEDLNYGLLSGKALKNPLIMLEFSLEKAFLFRGIHQISPLIPLFARLGEIDKALTLTYRLGDPKERAKNLSYLSSVVVEQHPEFAQSFLGEIGDFHQRALGAIGVAKNFPQDPVRFLEPILHDPAMEQLSETKRLALFCEILPLLAVSRPGWALRILESWQDLSERVALLAQCAEQYTQGEFAPPFGQLVEEAQKEIQKENTWKLGNDLALCLAVIKPRDGLAWVATIPEKESRAQALYALGAYGVKHHKRRWVQEILDQLPPGENRDFLLGAMALSVSDDLPQAGGFLDEIQHLPTKISYKIQWMEKNKSLDFLEEVQGEIEKIDSGSPRDLALGKLALALTKIDLAQAVDMVRTMEGEKFQISTFKDMGLLLAEESPDFARELLSLAGPLCLLFGIRIPLAKAYGAVGEALVESEKEQAIRLIHRAFFLIQKEPQSQKAPLMISLIGSLAKADDQQARELAQKIDHPFTRAQALCQAGESLPEKRHPFLLLAFESAKFIDSLPQKTRFLAKIIPLLALDDLGTAYEKITEMEESITAWETRGEVLKTWAKTDLTKALALWKDLSQGRILVGARILESLIERDQTEEGKKLLDTLIQLALDLSTKKEKIEALSRLRPLAGKVDSIREKEIDHHLSQWIEKIEDQGEKAQAQRMVALRTGGARVADGLERLEKSLKLDVSYRGVRDSRERAMEILLEEPYRDRLEQAFLLSLEGEDCLLNLLDSVMETLANLSDHSAEILLDALGYLEDSLKNSASILSGSVTLPDKIGEWEMKEHLPLPFETVDRAIQAKGKGGGKKVEDRDLLILRMEAGTAGEADLERLKEIYLQKRDLQKALEILQKLAELRKQAGRKEEAQKCFMEILELDPENPQARLEVQKGDSPSLEDDDESSEYITIDESVDKSREVDESPDTSVEAEETNLSLPALRKESLPTRRVSRKDFQKKTGASPIYEDEKDPLDLPVSGEKIDDFFDDGVEEKAGQTEEKDKKEQKEKAPQVPVSQPPLQQASPIEGYDIIEKIGQGAMAIVYKARDMEHNRIVALKVLLPEFVEDREYVARFIREARAVTSLHHPHIIKGYQAGESNGFYYFAMEYLEGQSLGQYIEEKGCLEEGEARRIIGQIAGALEHARQQAIIHRDIKPDNIILGKDGNAKLCDLGIAKELNQEGSLTQSGIALGTPYYISPEQAMGFKKIDIRTDIYSLGVTFYHMITGDVPYEGDTAALVMTKHISDPIPDPRQINPAISEETAEILIKMMAKDKEDRFQTPEELRQKLEGQVGKGKKSPESSESKKAIPPEQPIQSPPATTAPAPSPQQSQPSDIDRWMGIQAKAPKGKGIFVGWLIFLVGLVLLLLWLFG